MRKKTSALSLLKMKKSFYGAHFAKWMVVSAALVASTASSPSAEPRTLQTDRFGPIAVTVPHGEVRGLVLWLVDANPAGSADAIRSQLVGSGLAVASFSADRYLAKLREESCLQWGELVRLNQVIQSTMKFPRIEPALIAGEGVGAWIAFSALSLEPTTFRAGVLVDFCPTLAGIPNFCSDKIAGRYEPKRKLSRLASNTRLATPTVFVRSAGLRPRCSIDDVQSFDESDTTSVVLSKAGIERPLPAPELESLLDTVPVPDASGVNNDLDPVELPAENPTGKPLIIFWSGDGGWATIDKDLAGYFQEQGVNVVGISSLSYFWQPKTSEEIATTISTLISRYSAKWAPSEVILAGFSLGADVVPTALNRLHDAERTRVSSILLLSPGKTATFEVHLTDWLGVADDEGDIDSLQELKKVKIPVICVNGVDERDDSACPSLSGAHVTKIELPGGHHFDGDYRELGKRLLALLRPAPPNTPKP